MDPFAGLEEEFEFVDDIEANLLRDKKATLCASVTGLVERVQSDRSALGDTCDELVSYTSRAEQLTGQMRLFEEGQIDGLERHFVASHGMLACVVRDLQLARPHELKLT